MIKRFLPFLQWYEGFNSKIFRYDLIAGLTVALVLIPQSMAYAQLAGLPAYYGLYAAFLPPMIASLFGSSRQLATGPVAVVSLMTSASLEPLATAGSEAFIAYAVLLALMVGIFQFILGILRLGIVVNLLSHPVIIGFTNAAALIIATSQLSKIFGVYVDQAAHHYETVFRVIKAAWHYTHLATLILAILAFAIMIILKRINTRLPNVLVAAVVTILLSWLMRFEHNHTTTISMIHSPEVRQLIERYNNTLDEIDAVSKVGLHFKTDDALASQAAMADSFTIKDFSEVCYRCHTSREFTTLGIRIEKGAMIGIKELLRLIHDIGLHERHLTFLKKKCPEYRQQIRSYLFESMETDSGKIFYIKGKAPDETGSDGSVWRIRVKNNKLDENTLFLSAGGDVVGEIPRGLPALRMPDLNLSIFSQLIMAAIIISLLGFMEAISIAKAIAIRTGHRLDPNQELIGQGLANIIGSFARSYPVSGSFSRSE